MEKVLRIEIKSLSWHLVWITAVCETVTVGLLPMFCDIRDYGRVPKSPLLGLGLGYIGTLTVMLLVTVFIRYLMSGRISDAVFRFEKPFFIAAWGGIYLALIFALQAVFLFLPYHTSTVMLRAAGSLAAATAILLACYRLTAARWRWISMALAYDSQFYRVLSVSILPAAFFLAIYEALALPLIELISSFADRWYAGLLLGALAGGVGAMGVVLLYAGLSRFTPKLRLRVCLQKNNPP